MKLIVLLVCSVVLCTACTTIKNTVYLPAKHYHPDNVALYDTICRLDSIFFHSYNQCATQIAQYAAFYDDSIEFYHDKGGLTTSKAAIVTATQNNICGKVTRELVKGSIEVYPIPGFGAIEIGLHIFHNLQEPPPKHPKVSRFTIVWKKYPHDWKIYRVISLH
jgi:hypothetical protein